jgi:hypothetical protein
MSTILVQDGGPVTSICVFKKVLTVVQSQDIRNYDLRVTHHQ